MKLHEGSIRTSIPPILPTAQALRANMPYEPLSELITVLSTSTTLLFSWTTIRRACHDTYRDGLSVAPVDYLAHGPGSADGRSDRTGNMSFRPNGRANPIQRDRSRGTGCDAIDQGIIRARTRGPMDLFGSPLAAVSPTLERHFEDAGQDDVEQREWD